ncbi:MAG: stage II sporulation protein R [Clostridiales bacterium]|nr:MAG: stage II sporulation protein R [Clostridiales bacterium]
MRKNGYDYPCESDVRQKAIFPTKAYGKVTLPAGTYEALKVEIGEAKGKKTGGALCFLRFVFVDASSPEMSAEAMAVLKEKLDR